MNKLSNGKNHQHNKPSSVSMLCFWDPYHFSTFLFVCLFVCLLPFPCIKTPLGVFWIIFKNFFYFMNGPIVWSYAIWKTKKQTERSLKMNFRLFLIFFNFQQFFVGMFTNAVNDPRHVWSLLGANGGWNHYLGSWEAADVSSAEI